MELFDVNSVNRSEKINELLQTGFYKKEELVLLHDSILNDLYLKKLVDTGKLSIDETGKPWITYYQDRPYKFINYDSSLYENYIEANKDNDDGIAIFDYNNGRVIKHYELKQLVDAFANGLIEYGFDKNKRIGVMVLGTCEEPMCLLSPNKNGSLIKYIDFTKGPDYVKHVIDSDQFDVIFMDEMLMPLEGYINEKNVPLVILNATKDYSNTKFLTFDKVLKTGASKSINDKTDKLNSEPSIIINSSGTTGLPKPIVHSNQTLNLAAQKVLFTDYEMKRGNYILKSIPSHIGLGLITTMYSSLLSGTGVVLAKNDGPENAIKFTIDFLKNYRNILKQYNLGDNADLLLFTAPMFYRMISENLGLVEDLSFCKALLAAGSKMGKEELDIFNELYSMKGCTVPIVNGYGQNELCGAVTLNNSKHNVNGSGGYPVIGTALKVIDIDTLKEVPYGVEGRIIEQSDSKCLCYENMKEETEKSLITLPDGSKWFDTKDIGYIDNNGFVFITGRVSRVLIRFDIKLPMDIIENKIRNHYAVKDCVVFGKKTMGENEEPIAVLELNDAYKTISIEQIISEIQNSDNKLTDIEMPIDFEIVESLPYNNGKIDYKAVESNYTGSNLKLIKND